MDQLQPQYRVCVEQVICDSVSYGPNDRSVYRSFLCPFVPTVGMLLTVDLWESGEIKNIVADREADGSWTITCYPKEDRRRVHGSVSECLPVDEIVAEYLEDGWEES